MQYVSSNVDPPVKTTKPSLFSKEWWKNIGSAVKFHRYSPRDWAIWNISSWVTYATVFGVLQPVWSWVSANAAFIPNALAAAKAGISVVWGFLVAVVLGVLKTIAT
jgi:hypothetical protein